MASNIAQKLIEPHRVSGGGAVGAPLALRIDQTLTQDATGTLAMLSLEAMKLDRVKTEVSVQYVDHNLLQIDNLNAEDHLFLESACRRYGIWYSPPGNGISHVVHMERFGRPGKSLLGSDSHSPAAGSLCMLAIGAGGIDVALAMAGEPYATTMPAVFGVELTGALPDWVSAKDVILEMLRRHGVAGGVGKIIEYHGAGLRNLASMDRHVIANMGAELGATTSVFPSDEMTRAFLESQGRGQDWRELTADLGCAYDQQDHIDLSKLEPLIAKPSSPGKVVSVREVQSEEIAQSYIGSSANPGWRDFAIAAEIVRGRTVPPGVSFDVNPTSRQVLQMLINDGAPWRARRCRRAHSPDRMQRLHRHGASSGDRTEFASHHAAQFPGTLGNGRRFSVPVYSGNGGRLCSRRQNHRSEDAGHFLSETFATSDPEFVALTARAAASDRTGARSRVGQGGEHQVAARIRSASR